MTTRDADYFSEKYGLTRTHSEVLHGVFPGRPVATVSR
jgi:tellurite methyltransferase